jgi:hypothetical protein
MALWHEEKPHENDFTLADVGRARFEVARKIAGKNLCQEIR